MWSFAKKVGLCTPCAVSAVCYTGSRLGAHKGGRHCAHKAMVRTRMRTSIKLVHTLWPVHTRKWCAKGCAQARVPGTVRTMVCTRRRA